MLIVMSIKQLALLTARNLRKNQTQAEKMFWGQVRNRQINGFKFLRQYPIYFEYENRRRFFIADFFCQELNLVVEIDGGIHLKQKDYDILRTKIMEVQKGLRIVRFSNEEVMKDFFSVKKKLIGIIDNL